MRPRLTPVSSVIAIVAAAIIATGIVAAGSSHSARPVTASVSAVLPAQKQQHQQPVNVSTDTYSVHRIVLTGSYWYRVRHGDSLSGIAARLLGSSSRWPSLYRANRRVIGSNPDNISPGENLTLNVSGYSNAPVSIPESRSGGTLLTSSTVRVSDYSGFQACVIARESGGNPDIWNASGHWGLYQFSYSTWIAYGGPPSEFGRASVAEQNQVFENAMARNGEDNWAPYDGC
jgi:hypothetical protein